MSHMSLGFIDGPCTGVTVYVKSNLEFGVQPLGVEVLLDGCCKCKVMPIEQATFLHIALLWLHKHALTHQELKDKACVLSDPPTLRVHSTIKSTPEMCATRSHLLVQQ